MEHGLKLLGTPLGHPEYVSEQLERLATEHQTLLDRIPVVPDLQCAWAILLHCASAGTNYVIRVVRPEQSLRFARCHDEGLWRCMCNLLELPRDCVFPVVKDSCTLPLVLGGLGLRSATTTREPAFWVSWADALHMIHQRNPTIADEVVEGLVRAGGSPNLTEGRNAANNLRGVHGFEPPSWDQLRLGARSPPQQVDELRVHKNARMATRSCFEGGSRPQKSPRVPCSDPD